jgi:hypothetical protein
MIPLTHRHPAQLCLGAVLIGLEKAQAKGQMLFESICRDAADSALESVDVLREIATDASNLEDEIAKAAADGVFTAEERQRLAGFAVEIREEARTGRII